MSKTKTTPEKDNIRQRQRPELAEASTSDGDRGGQRFLGRQSKTNKRTRTRFKTKTLPDEDKGEQNCCEDKLDGNRLCQPG